MTEVYEVATFYHHFDVVKDGEAAPPRDHGARVRFALLRDGRRRSDSARRACRGCSARDVRVLPAPCVGRCEQAPVAVVGQQSASAMRPRARSSAAGRTRRRSSRAGPSRTSTTRSTAPAAATRCSPNASRGQRTLEIRDRRRWRTPALRGLGGAGFPAGRKWKIVRAEPAPRLLAVNIDEGEPGTFKDRYYLERDPHRFLEGMLIAAWAAGIAEIYIYLRDEYAGCRAHPRRGRLPRSRPIRRARCRRSICGAAPARTSAAKSRR